MLEFLKSWITNIIILIILITLVEMLMPDTKYKRYIDLVIGIIVMISIIQPVLGFLSKKDINISLPTVNYDYQDSNIKEYQQKQDQLFLKTYKSNLEQQISEYISNKYNIKVVSTDIALNKNNPEKIQGIVMVINDNSIKPIKKVSLRDNVKENNNFKENIIRDISLVYNLPITNISIVDK